MVKSSNCALLTFMAMPVHIPHFTYNVYLITFFHNLFYSSRFIFLHCFCILTKSINVKALWKISQTWTYVCFLGGSVGKEPARNAGDLGLILGLGRSPRDGNGNPPQYPCLGSPMDTGAWRATGGHKESRTT